MKNNKSVLLAFVLACSGLTPTAAETALLLIGKSQTTSHGKTVVSDGARATLKTAAGLTHVTADEITFDREKNMLLCAGESTVSSSDRTYKGKDLTIELTDSVRLAVLSPNPRWHLGFHAENPGFEAWSPRAEFTPLFEKQLPNIDLDLKRSNRLPPAVQPFVTPRAFQAPPGR